MCLHKIMQNFKAFRQETSKSIYNILKSKVYMLQKYCTHNNYLDNKANFHNMNKDEIIEKKKKSGFKCTE